MTWVSYEPWGWVPYHYGSWDYLPAYGWALAARPRLVARLGLLVLGSRATWAGARPATTPATTGRSFGVGFGFRYGVYGWAGGSWGYYDHWNFVHSGYFAATTTVIVTVTATATGTAGGTCSGMRCRERLPGTATLDRGIITTDTRPIKPGIKNPDEVLRALRSGDRNARSTEDLPDVTSFIARKPELPSTVLRTVRNDGTTNLDGTPLKPSTLGRDRRAVGGVAVNGAQPGDNAQDNTGSSNQPGKPRIVFGDDGPSARGASPSGRSTQGAAAPQPTKPETRSGNSSTGTDSSNSGRPRIVIEKPDGPSGSPAAGEPTVRERPARPAPGADGGAPRPRRVEIDSKPSPRTEDRSSSGSSSNDAPVVQVRPSRPAPEADGGAPRPDRNDSGNSDRGSRSSSSEDRPEVREHRPAVDREQIQRQIEIDRQRESDNRQRETERSREPEVRERSQQPREESYSRPEPSRREPEPRVEPRRDPSPDRSSESRSRPEPRVEPKPEPERSRGSDGGQDGGHSRGSSGGNSGNNNGGNSGGDRGSRSSGGNDRPQVRERRPPAN